MDSPAYNIEEAVQGFYRNPQGNDALHQLITKEQRSKAAWQFCWSMLQTDKTPEVQFYGASTLRLKIYKFWHEMQIEHLPQLRNRLLEVLLAHAAMVPRNKAVIDKLCQAMAGLVAHSVDSEWATAISDLVSLFQTTPGLNEELRCSLLLSILSSLGCCLSDLNYGVRRGQRAAVYAQLMSEFPRIRDMLEGLTQQNLPNSLKLSITRCVESWIELGVELTDCENLIDTLFSWLIDPDLFNEISDSLIPIFDVRSPSKYTNTLTKYLIKLAQLQPLWLHLIQQEDLDTCASLSRLVVEFTEANIQILLSMITGPETQRNAAQTVVNMILSFSDIPGTYGCDEKISSIPFKFWYNLQDSIIGELPSEETAKLLPVFIPVYSSLVNLLLRKVQYPSLENYNNMSAEDKEEFRCYRMDVSDTVLYSYCLLKHEMFKILDNYFKSLSEILAASLSAPSVPSAPPDVSWQQIESLLYVTGQVTQDSMASGDESDEDEGVESNCGRGRVTTAYFLSLMKQFGLLLPRLAPLFNNSILLNTTLDCLGAFADQYELMPVMLSVALPVILLHGLKRPETVLLATRALKDICSNNDVVLHPYAVGILNVCLENLNNNLIQGKNGARLLSCVGHLLSSLPYPTTIEWLDKFLPPISQSLLSALQAASGDASQRPVIHDRLVQISWLFDSLDLKPDPSNGNRQAVHLPPNADQPVLVVLRDLLPVLKRILTSWSKDDTIVQSCFEVVKHGLLTLLDDFSSVLPDVCQLIVSTNQIRFHPSLLDCTERITLVFVSTPTLQPLVVRLNVDVVGVSLARIEAAPRAATDEVESVAQLTYQLVKKCSEVINSPGYPLQRALTIAAIGLGLPERPTTKACHFVWLNILRSKHKFPRLDEVMGQLIPLLYQVILSSMAGAYPRQSVLEFHRPVLDLLLKHYLEASSQTLRQLLAVEGFPAPHLTPQDKETFATRLLKERSKKRVELFEEFLLHCHGLSGTQYGQETSTLLPG